MATIYRVPQSVRAELINATRELSELLAKLKALNDQRAEFEAAVLDADKQLQHEGMADVAEIQAAIDRETARVTAEQKAHSQWVNTVLEPAKERWHNYQYFLGIAKKHEARGEKVENYPGEIPDDPATLKAPTVQPIPQALFDRLNSQTFKMQGQATIMANAVRALIEHREKAKKLDGQILDAEKRLVAAQDALLQAERREEDSIAAAEEEKRRLQREAEAEVAQARAGLEEAERRAAALREGSGN